MKVLTVLFLIYYIYQLFRQGGFMATSLKKYYNTLPKDTLHRDAFEGDIGTQGVQTVMACMLYLIISVIEFIYVIIATKYGSFTIAYLGFWIFVLLYGQIKKPNNNATIEEAINKLNKFRIRQFIYNVVDVAYFGMMFYVLFM